MHPTCRRLNVKFSLPPMDGSVHKEESLLILLLILFVMNGVIPPSVEPTKNMEANETKDARPAVTPEFTCV